MTTEELAKMSPEEKRVKIAEACGWNFIQPDGGKTHWLMQAFLNGDWKFQTSGGFGNFFPDYINSLDALHEAEKVLLADIDKNGYYNKIHKYSSELHKVSENNTMHPCYSAVHATSAQRADAFLLML